MLDSSRLEDQVMTGPNLQFTCPDCSKSIAIIWDGPIDLNREIDLECPNPPCEWRGRLPLRLALSPSKAQVNY
jgi:hypothetical protein